MALKLFLTGDPGCGKTTAVRRVVERLRGRVRMTGFITEELRRDGRRIGFRGVTLDGTPFPLADRDARGELRVGPYRVVLDGLESIGLAALEPGGAQLVVLDEVGKMELLSSRFRERVTALVEGTTPLLATIALHGVGFIRRLRHDPRVTLVKMSRHDSDTAVGDAIRRLRDAGVVPRRNGTGRS
ncbi:MAG TPA: nucleoside-triphosphatase [Candidatus Polarisedimenticolaceae bacterium]|nr:nucleoside-triphosphatase [Candidatus Polarisedimenticolaceae bacterium]